MTTMKDHLDLIRAKLLAWNQEEEPYTQATYELASAVRGLLLASETWQSPVDVDKAAILSLAKDLFYADTSYDGGRAWEKAQKERPDLCNLALARARSVASGLCPPKTSMTEYAVREPVDDELRVLINRGVQEALNKVLVRGVAVRNVVLVLDASDRACQIVANATGVQIIPKYRVGELLAPKEELL